MTLFCDWSIFSDSSEYEKYRKRPVSSAPITRGLGRAENSLEVDSFDGESEINFRECVSIERKFTKGAVNLLSHILAACHLGIECATPLVDVRLWGFGRGVFAKFSSAVCHSLLHFKTWHSNYAVAFVESQSVECDVLSSWIISFGMCCKSKIFCQVFMEGSFHFKSWKSTRVAEIPFRCSFSKTIFYLIVDIFWLSLNVSCCMRQWRTKCQKFILTESSWNWSRKLGFRAGMEKRPPLLPTIPGFTSSTSSHSCETKIIIIWGRLCTMRKRATTRLRPRSFSTEQWGGACWLVMIYMVCAFCVASRKKLLSEAMVIGKHHQVFCIL